MAKYTPEEINSLRKYLTRSLDALDEKVARNSWRIDYTDQLIDLPLTIKQMKIIEDCLYYKIESLEDKKI